MKILIIDDSETRANKLSLALLGALSASHVDVARSFMEGTDALRETVYDLLVLDINIPIRAGGAPSNNVSLELLDEIESSPELLKPRSVVGITVFDEAFREAEEKFRSRLWKMIKCDDLNSDWMKTIVAAAKWMSDAEASASVKDYGIDLLLIAALPSPEMVAIHSLPWDWLPWEVADKSTFVRRGFFKVGEERFSVVSCSPTRMGMVSAGIVTSKLIALYRPRFVAMAGICAGVKNKVAIGDAIFADPTWDYQSGKISLDDDGESIFLLSPHHLNVPEFLRSRFEQISHDSAALRAIRDGWREGKHGDIGVHIGPLGTGSAVLADGSTIAGVADTQQRQLLGIDMELYGIFSAVSLADTPTPTAFGVKAVCDFADGGKSDKDQGYAAYVAANVLGLFVQRFFAEIRDYAGS